MIVVTVVGIVVKKMEQKQGKFGDSCTFTIAAQSKRGVKFHVSCVHYGALDAEKFKKGSIVAVHGDLDVAIHDDDVRLSILAKYADPFDPPVIEKKEEKEFELPF